MSDVERVAVVIALVGAFRTRNAAGHLYAPFLEGNAVTLLAALVGAALSATGSPSAPWHAIARGIVLGTVAAGVMTALKYAGDHVGIALGRALILTRPRHGRSRTYVGEAPAHGGGPSP